MKSVLKYQYVLDQRVVEGYDNGTVQMGIDYKNATIALLNALEINFMWFILKNDKGSNYYMIVFVDKKFDVIQEWRLGYYIKKHIKDEYLIDCGSLIRMEDLFDMNYPVIHKYIFKQPSKFKRYTIRRWMKIQKYFESFFEESDESYVGFLMGEEKSPNLFLIIFTTKTFDVFKSIDVCDERFIIDPKSVIKKGTSTNFSFFIK